MKLLKKAYIFFSEPIKTDTYIYKPENIKLEELLIRLEYLTSNKLKSSRLDVEYLNPRNRENGTNFTASFKWGLLEDNYKQSVYIDGAIAQSTQPQITINIKPEIPNNIIGFISPLFAISAIIASIYLLNIIPGLLGLVFYMFHRYYLINAKKNIKIEFERSFLKSNYP